MAREKWLVDPGEYDEFQREIAGLKVDDSYIVKGCAGSGKTILALERASNVRIEAIAENENASPDFTLVVFTKALREFIASGVREKGLNLKQIIHYAKWDKVKVDYLIVDESQDFTKEEIDTFMSVKRKSIMLYGDTQQQIYTSIKAGGVLSIEEIEKYLKIPHRELLKNYRLPKSIAAFAQYLSDDKLLESKCVKPGTERPKIIQFENWKQELDYIIAEIGNRNYTDVAILLPFNINNKARRNNNYRNVEDVKKYFDEKNFRHQFKIRDDDNDTMELDFDSDLPKVMTYHSSKGLQFETVFIPFCDYPNHDDWFIPKYKTPLYVALTRTYRNLIITHTERLTPYFSPIPTSKYDRT